MAAVHRLVLSSHIHASNPDIDELELLVLWVPYARVRMGRTCFMSRRVSIRQQPMIGETDGSRRLRYLHLAYGLVVDSGQAHM